MEKYKLWHNQRIGTYIFIHNHNLNPIMKDLFSEDSKVSDSINNETFLDYYHA